MNEIIISDSRNYNFSEIRDIYNNAGWTAYTNQPSVLEKALENTPYILTARHNGIMAGLLRAVGDGLTIMYIQDIIVHETYRRKGIATQLMNTLLKQYSHVRQIILLTDDKQETSAFYESIGLRRTSELSLCSYMKVK